MGRRATAAVLAAGVGCALWLSFPNAVNGHAAVQATLPSDRLNFGLSNGPGELSWMTSSGVPWRYRYAYLSGGVNTLSGWETWQDPAMPPGQYAVDYMSSSTTSPASYLPVFSYYELLQSSPSTGGTELDRDFSNLNNNATMKSYYANFKLLMQKAGAYTGPVVVHVEPDLWAYMQQKGQAGGATTADQVPASVGSSGFADVGGYANSVQGFACALLHLRDLYAPQGNVVMAIHASLWSSGIDIGSDTNPGTSAAVEADKTATFLNSACAGANPYGGSTWDVVFNDVADHDAGWFEAQNSPRWWDRTNHTLPNFARYLAWVAELHGKTGKPQVVWQVPVGNQYYLTENNTDGHYQDNRAEYFLNHTGDLFAAGLIAVLFGRGNAHQTTYTDDKGDGVTNNSGVPTTDVLGGCSACNTHVSSWSDDDGGYLRVFVGQYYTGCKSASVTPNLASPQARGTLITLTATSTGCGSPDYEFWLQNPTGTWVMKQTFSVNPTWAWDTTGFPLGTYTIHVWANESGAGTGTWQAYGSATYTLSAPPPCATAGLLPANPTAPAGSVVALTASSTVCPNPRYEFWAQYPGGVWHLIRGWGGSAFSWSTATLAPGAYLVHVWANQLGDPTATWEAYGSDSVTLSGCGTASLSPPSGSSPVGASVMFTAGSTGCTSPVYEFWLQYPGGSWYRMTGFGANSWTWSTVGGYPKGSYVVHVWANNQGADTSSWEAYASATHTLT
jgi:hypothetical protein